MYLSIYIYIRSLEGLFGKAELVLGASLSGHRGLGEAEVVGSRRDQAATAEV